MSRVATSTSAEVLDWLAKQVRTRKIRAVVHRELARAEDDRFLYVPVHVKGRGDAYDKASILQDLEDQWNNQPQKPRWRLLLVPSPN